MRRGWQYGELNGFLDIYVCRRELFYCPPDFVQPVAYKDCFSELNVPFFLFLLFLSHKLIDSIGVSTDSMYKVSPGQHTFGMLQHPQ